MTTPMSSDNKELQDWESEIIQICTDLYYDCDTIKILDELTDKAIALIADQCRLARIDELQLAIDNFEWGKGTDHLDDRIKTLESEK
jgi:hypothetical protein